MLGERKRRFDRRNVDPELTKLELWPGVNVLLLKEAEKERFLRLQRAIEAYLVHLTPAKVIKEEYGIDRHSIARIAKRCLRLDRNGKIWGFRALVYYCRQKHYERRSRVKAGNGNTKGGYAGKLGLLFDTYPALQELVNTLFLKKSVRGVVHEPRISIAHIHARFIKECRNIGIKETEYPFTVKEMGRVALWNYLNKTFHDEIEKATKARQGKNAGRKVRQLPSGVPENIPVTRPLERVEFDAHRIDAFFVILIVSAFGGVVEKVLDRIWILVIIDTITRAVLGYHFCFNKEYSSEDVLQCVKKAIVPWKPRDLTIPGLAYPDKGGVPSTVFKEMEYALWDEFAYDNAKANISDRVVTGMTTTVGCAVAPGRVEFPDGRNLIERFFGILAENGFHRLPSTTGNKPDDPRRQDPEKAALAYRISLQDLEELTDVMIAQYNGRPSSGLGGRTPLESLSYFLNSEGWIPRQLSRIERENLRLLNLQVTRQIKGDVRKGISSFINFEGVRYKSEILSRSTQLIGQKLILNVDPEDPRSVRVYLPNGAEFGVLTAQGIWGRVPHTLEQRRAILQLRRRRLLYYTDNDDPIEIYLDYLAKEAVTGRGRGARRKVARLQHEGRRRPVRTNGGSDVEDKITPDTTDGANGARPEAGKFRFAVPSRKTYNR